MADLVYERMPHFPKEVEATINAAMMLAQSDTLPVSCYQISEGIAHVLRELQFDENARAIACDVYAWNHDMVAHAAGVPIKPPKPNPRHPQRKRRGKTRPDLRPYYLCVFHEQAVDAEGYDGHVIVEANGYMIDATANQFHRPKMKVHSKDYIVFPAASCQPLPDEYRDLIIWPRGDHPDAGRDLFAHHSLKNELIAISSPHVLREQGQMAYCIRPDIDSDRWMSMTPQTKINIESSNKLMLSVAQQLMEHDPTKNEGGSITVE